MQYLYQCAYMPPMQLIIILIRQFVKRRNMSVKSLQLGRRTANTTQIKFMTELQNMTAETNES